MGLESSVNAVTERRRQEAATRRQALADNVLQLQKLAKAWATESAWLESRGLQLGWLAENLLQLKNERFVLSLSASSEGISVNLIPGPDELIFPEQGQAADMQGAEQMSAEFLENWIRD